MQHFAARRCDPRAVLRTSKIRLSPSLGLANGTAQINRGYESQSPLTFRLPRSLRILNTSDKAAGPSLRSGRETGLVKGASVIWADSCSLSLQRRAGIYWEDGTPGRAFLVKKANSREAAIKLKEIAEWCA